jgi:membrane-bound lytic murein transglycosylase MltF
MGFEYELLKLFAQHLGVELDVQIVHNLDSLQLLLNTGKGDIVACNYTVTKERAERINFSEPFLKRPKYSFNAAFKTTPTNLLNLPLLFKILQN